ncbi:MAG: hypothetical protein PWR27_1890 [Petroclostridium sp.]|uniref:PRC-barrel domain-containing protein n=1 Tax=Petroclostridium xylanilyticum TaxID=1792311 RepID=UPI000B989C89|nr:PRC-barrel domain-containing protein [Petroclostridium xylanilyticum]MBZ4645551.1 PRC-barrel domain protein [Clostridia bacterium]MDK2811181.1 hypothetical protein [Petroclostridium sp.]
MLKFSEIIGLPVISISTGNRIGVVKDIIFISTTKKILALIINNKKIMSNTKAIKVEDIVKAGRSAILVKDEKCVISLDQLPQLPNMKKYRDEIVDLQVYTDSGVNLGTVQDASFDFEIGMLEEIEISDGIVQDLIEGRKFIPATESIQLEKGIVIVESEKVHQLKTNGKGIKKYLLKGSSKNEKK